MTPEAFDPLFRTARTHSVWQPRPVTDELLRELYELLKFAPTSANCSPARFLFIKSAAAKARLLPLMDSGNVEKTRTAPVTAVVGYDTEFYEKLGFLFPHDQTARSWFAGKPAKIEATAFRNGTLQGAYLMLAARALGLDVGGMSGFDNEKVDREFFANGKVKSNFMVNIGYGDGSRLFPRSPRLPFDEAAQIL